MSVTRGLQRLLAGLACSLPVLVATAAAGDCLLSVEVQGVAFGTYDPADQLPLETHGEIRLTCLDSQGAVPTAEVTLSAGGSGRFDHREMSLGESSLLYNLYLDPSRSLVWGDGTATSASLTAGGQDRDSAGLQSYPVYGRIFAGQTVPSGQYGDAVVVTIAF